MAWIGERLGPHQIRLLLLQPAGSHTELKNVEIVCDMQVVSLSDKPKYEALSYRWGDAQDTKTITVRGEPAIVTATLGAALMRLRLPRRPRALWIDQLCIDQSDNDEKIQQVRMMDVIYRSCTQCVIWLGEVGAGLPDEDAAAAFELLEYIADSNRVPNSEAFSTAEAFHGAMKGIDAMSIKQHPWWKRVWTLQESVLPPHKLLVWGSHTLPWSVLSEATSGRINGYSSELWAHLDMYAKSTEVVSLDPLGWLLLHVTWTDGTLSDDDSNAILLPVSMIWREKRYATNPVGQVFGYLGLVPRKQLFHTKQCDYTTSAGHLYNATTIDLILLQGLLPLLMCPRAKPGTGTENIARWAIDLQGQIVYTVDGFYVYWGYDHYNACRNRPLDTELLLREARDSGGTFEILGMRGHKVDQVAVISSDRNVWPKWAPGPPTKSIHVVLLKWLAFADKHVRELLPAASHEDVEEAFGRFLLGDLVRNGEMWFERRPTSDDVSTALANIRSDSAEIHSGLGPQTSAFYSQVCNQAFLVTQDGMLGISHKETEIGDEIWIFEGGKVPFVLRPRAGEDGDVIDRDFVGFGYVQGLMFGEFFEGANADVVSKEVHVH